MKSVDRPRRSVKAMDVVFMVANAIGVATYLELASRGWRLPQEHGAIPIAGEPFVWAFALPVLGFFVMANTVWGVMVLRQREVSRWRWLFITGALWLLAIYIDFAHH